MTSKAEISDSEALTALTIRSKSYWGYDNEQIEMWLDELAITDNYIAENEVYQLVEDNVLVGFYAYAPENDLDVKLDYLFVCPKFIGKGYGSRLLEDFLVRVQGTSFGRVVLYADPHAEKFYIKRGFEVIGKLESAIKDRFLPIMAKNLQIS